MREIQNFPLIQFPANETYLCMKKKMRNKNDYKNY